MEREMEFALEEYKLVKDECKHYFDFAYRNMSMAIAFFATITVFGLSVETNYFSKQAIFLYVLPVCGYVFGLLYFYCYSALAKLSYSEAVLEQKMKEKGFIGYTKVNKTYKAGYIVSYGTSYAFFLVVPLISIIIGQNSIDEVKNIVLFGHSCSCVDALVLKVIPWGFYGIYCIFSIIIFCEMGRLMKKANEIYRI